MKWSEMPEKTKKRIRKIIILAAVCLTLFGFFFYENHHLTVSHYTYNSEKISEGLDGFKIVQISDLHNANFGIGNGSLLDKIREEEPDLIALTGDLVDSNHTNIERALNFAEAAATICPVYYVTGNHEYWLSAEDRDRLLTGLEEREVRILDNEAVTISVGEVSFYLVGLDDRNLTDATLGNLLVGHEEELSVVLAHEPQCLAAYAQSGADLVLSGHAHGGQFRLPFIGGLVAPDQGFFPQYTAGEYTEDSTTMIVSRGLGNSIIPVRFFNDPEIVNVKLSALTQ